jgi:hypothetical protein
MILKKAIIEIEDDKVLVASTRMNNAGFVETDKVILSLEEFIHTIKSTDQSLHTGIFCTNTIKYEYTSNNVILWLFSPQCKVNLKTRTNTSEVKIFDNVLFPSFILKAKFDKSNRFITSIIRMTPNKYSVSDFNGEINDFFMPFPNVYSDSKVCWGKTLENINITPSNANLLLDIFKNSVFNHDLFNDVLIKIKNNISEVTGYESYFNYLSTLEDIPNELCFQASEIYN